MRRKPTDDPNVFYIAFDTVQERDMVFTEWNFVDGHMAHFPEGCNQSRECRATAKDPDDPNALLFKFVVSRIRDPLMAQGYRDRKAGRKTSQPLFGPYAVGWREALYEMNPIPRSKP